MELLEGKEPKPTTNATMGSSYQPYFLWKEEIWFTFWWATRERTHAQGWVRWVRWQAGRMCLMSQLEELDRWPRYGFLACWIHVIVKGFSFFFSETWFFCSPWCREIHKPKRSAWGCRLSLKTIPGERLAWNGQEGAAEEGELPTSLRLLYCYNLSYSVFQYCLCWGHCVPFQFW